MQNKMHEGNYLVILLCSHCFHHSPVFPGVRVLMLWCLGLMTLLSNEWISFCLALINQSYGVFSFPPFWWLSKSWDFFFYWLLNLYLIWEVRADIWYMNIKHYYIKIKHSRLTVAILYILYLWWHFWLL